MKKALLGVLGFIVIAAGSIYLFRIPLKEMTIEKLVADMFVPADTDTFDPGLAIGDRFPPLLAEYQGQTITDMGEFISDKGMVFMANRSVDW
ncbi:MAG: hypothetical protein O7F73_12875 [Gammaproteobacteria bacterium]|nr:hypothetical protein [Gammaproteobacteria bacterium]